MEDVLRTEVNSQFLVLTGGEGLDDLLNHIIVPEQKQIVPDTAMHCINIVPGEASLLVHFKNTQDLPSPGSQPSLILLGFSLVLEFYFLLNFAACFILLPA